jgi:hypothetical protein
MPTVANEPDALPGLMPRQKWAALVGKSDATAKRWQDQGKIVVTYVAKTPTSILKRRQHDCAARISAEGTRDRAAERLERCPEKPNATPDRVAFQHARFPRSSPQAKG